MGKWPSNIKVKLYLSLEVPICSCADQYVSVVFDDSQHTRSHRCAASSTATSRVDPKSDHCLVSPVILCYAFTEYTTSQTLVSSVVQCCEAPPVTLLVGLGPSQHQLDSQSRLNIKPMNCGSGHRSGNARPTLEWIKAISFSEVEPGLSMTVSACMRSMPGSFSFQNWGSVGLQ